MDTVFEGHNKLESNTFQLETINPTSNKFAITSFNSGMGTMQHNDGNPIEIMNEKVLNLANNYS